MKNAPITFWFKGLLKEKRISQKELAEILNRPKKTICLIIKGEKGITPQTALQFQQVFNISAEEFLAWDSSNRLQKAKDKLFLLRQEKKDVS